MSTWEEIKEKWEHAQQAAVEAERTFNRLGYQALMAAVEVGEDLQVKKRETPHGEFLPNAARVLGLPLKSASPQASRLMRLALHRDLIEHQKPESMRSALKLLPHTPKKPSEKKVAKDTEELTKLEEFAKKTAKEQAEILAKKIVKVELDRLQTQAHDAVKTELEALRKQLKKAEDTLDKEREHVAELLEEAREKRQFYEDLINKRTNGHDFKQGMKLLRQMAHPDRETTTASLRAKAMHEIEYISRFLGV